MLKNFMCPYVPYLVQRKKNTYVPNVVQKD